MAKQTTIVVIRSLRVNHMSRTTRNSNFGEQTDQSLCCPLHTELLANVENMCCKGPYQIVRLPWLTLTLKVQQTTFDYFFFEKIWLDISCESSA